MSARSSAVEVKGVHEISVQPLAARSDLHQQRMRPLTMSSVFQPICGIFETWVARLDLDRPRRGSSRAPSVTSYSRPRSAISCMPTQMPKNGRPCTRTRLVQRFTMPLSASSPRRQSAKAPTPGSTTRSARYNDIGIAGHDDRLVDAASARAARSNALAAECRLPEP